MFFKCAVSVKTAFERAGILVNLAIINANKPAPVAAAGIITAFCVYLSMGKSLKIFSGAWFF